MTKSPRPPAKPHTHIEMMGQVGSGKTTLTEAITKVLADRDPVVNRYVAFTGIDRATEVTRCGLPLGVIHVEYETATHRYSHVDIPGQVTPMISARSSDAAILAVSARDEPAQDDSMPQTREHVRRAWLIGVPRLIVALTKADTIDDGELLDVVELEVRELLTEYGFPGPKTPVVRVSGLRALAGDPRWTASIAELLDAIDDYVPNPTPALARPFLMPIEDAMTISGRGTLVIGRIEHGILTVGDSVEVVGLGPTLSTVATGLERFRRDLDRAEAGDNAAVFLRGIEREQVARGQVLALPGSITPHQHFAARAYSHTEDEGGRSAGLHATPRLQFYFRNTPVPGSLDLGELATMAPGDTADVTVVLDHPIALDAGLRFTVREGRDTVASGVVTALLD